MWEQIRSNQIRSVILVAGMAVLLLLIGYFLGIYFLDSGTGGVIIALIIWAVMNLAALPFLRKGLMMYIGAEDLLADFTGAVEAASFSSAEASPSGYLVYRAEEESARYSLFLEMAK